MAQCEQCGRQLPPFTFRKICQWCVQHHAAQRGDDSAYQRVEAAPWLRQQSTSMVVTQVIFGINAAVFLAMTLAVGMTLFGDPAWNELTVRLGANVGPYTIAGQWWRLLTNIFIHGGLLHFAFNMWCLWSLGRLAESVYGHWTFAAVYLICGLSASLGSILWNPGVQSVGASGAIFGIAGALIASFYLGEFSLPRSAISGMLRSVVAFVGYNLVFGAMIAHVDNAAHIGGLVMGLILGALIARFAPQHDAILQRIGVLVFGAVLVACGAPLARSRAYRAYGHNSSAPLTAANLDAAIKELQKAAKERPDFVPVHLGLAQAYLDKQDYESAAVELKRVVALDPRNEDAYYDLGRVYLQANQPAKAEDAFTQLLKINPNSANGHAGMGRIFAYERRYEEALAEYKRVADIDSLYQGVYFKIGVLEAQLNQYDDAIAALLKQRQTWDDADNERQLAEVYEAEGMTKEAKAARAKAEELSGKN